MMHEDRLKHYFEQESAKRELSAHQWRSVLSQVKTQNQRRGVWRAVTLLTPQRPLLATAATLVLAVMAVGTSLWITAPWAASPFPEPTLTDAAPIPAPTIFEDVWEADKRLITPGEPVTITLGFKNVWDKPVVFSEFPTTMTLIQVDKRVEESIPLKLQNGEGAPGPMEPGDELVVMATVSPNVSAGFQSGRYSLEIRFQFAHTPGRPEMGQKRSGLSSGILFVVIPPEGALEKTVVVGQAREGSGVRITLNSVHFTPEETSIVAVAALLANGSAVSKPAFAPTPTPVIRPQGTPAPVVPSQGAPTPAVGQPAWDGDLTELTAFYRLAGGRWHLLRWSHYRETPDGVHHGWSFGPVSANADTFEFAIIPGVRPGRDGTFAYPTDDGTSPWEWTVPLQEIEKRQETQWSQTGMEHPLAMGTTFPQMASSGSRRAQWLGTEYQAPSTFTVDVLRMDTAITLRGSKGRSGNGRSTAHSWANRSATLTPRASRRWRAA